jgi:hypothetical protein
MATISGGRETAFRPIDRWSLITIFAALAALLNSNHLYRLVVAAAVMAVIRR